MSEISVFGGTGYLGYHVVAALAKVGHNIKVFSRKPIIHTDLQSYPNITFVKLPKDDAVLKTQLMGTEIIINLAGIMEVSKKRLDQANVVLPKKLYEMAHELNIPQMLHTSALGAMENSKSRYFKSKYAAESALMARAKNLPVRMSIIKPSLIFGQHDPFFSRFIRLISMLPYMMLPCANAEFQPVYVDDVVAAIKKILVQQERGNEIYELAGPKRYTFIALIQMALKFAGVNPKKVGKMPNIFANLMGRFIGWFPKAPFTHDQFLSLQIPNVSDKNDLAHLGITPTSLESVLAFEYSAGVYDQYHTDRIIARRHESDIVNHP